jgi:hypothetical protein
VQNLSLRNKTFVVLLFTIILIATILLPAYKIAAQSADSIERAIQICEDDGGTWDEAARTCEYGPCELSDSVLGIPTWYKYLEKETDSTGKCNVMLSGSDTESKANSALPIGLAILEATLRLAGLVAVAMVFWGGFKYITSQGSPDSAKGARTTIINALIGLVIVIVSTSLVSFIGRSI